MRYLKCHFCGAEGKGKERGCACGYGRMREVDTSAIVSKLSRIERESRKGDNEGDKMLSILSAAVIDALAGDNYNLDLVACSAIIAGTSRKERRKNNGTD